MNTISIFAMQFSLSLLVIALLAKWHLSPWLDRQAPRQALFWLALPHAFRYIGMVFLVPGVVAQPLPEYFSIPAAYGDLTAGVLALLAMIALKNGWSSALALVWIFNIVGTADLFNALRHAEVVSSFGAAWYIPTFLVPLLLVTHFMIFIRLLRPVRSQQPVPRCYSNLHEEIQE